MARRKAPLIPDALLDQLLAGRDPQSALGRDGLVDELKRALAERALNAEMDHHLDGEVAEGRSNSRNGYGRKTVLTETGKLPIAVPRDRLATFEPQLIAKYRRRLPGFDDKIVSMYARGMTVREIQGHLAELYGIDVSPDLISAVTDAILDEIAEWQNRPLEAVYPLVFFDALRVKVRDEGTVRNKAVYLALGVRADGLKGFPDAITAVFPQAQVQTCIVHLIRRSLDFVSYKDRRAVAAALKEVYRAKDADAGAAALEAFAAGDWGRKYPAIALSWRRHWPAVIPFFAFPTDVRRIIYTTNAIEALNAKLRRAVRTRGHFPTDEAAIKLLYLVLNLAEREWRMPPREWAMARAQLAILFDDRFQLA